MKIAIFHCYVCVPEGNRTAVDGREILHQLNTVVLCRYYALFIGFQFSKMVEDIFHLHVVYIPIITHFYRKLALVLYIQYSSE